MIVLLAFERKEGTAMWGFHQFGWGIGMLIWMLFTWAAVVITVWFVLNEISGRHRGVHH